MTLNNQSDISRGIIVLSLQAAFYVLVLPFVFLFIGDYIDTQYFLLISYPSWIKLSIAIICTPIGMVFLPWAIFSLYKIEERAAASSPINPTFMVIGAYKLCRNPITFGALFYFVGLGALLGSLTTIIVSLLSTLIFGCLYAKMLTEKSFERKFKSAYRSYKETTPFLIPKLKK
jgi:protein-S-isoprenylcysteine O-methyltransferase Ste14